MVWGIISWVWVLGRLGLGVCMFREVEPAVRNVRGARFVDVSMICWAFAATDQVPLLGCLPAVC